MLETTMPPSKPARPKSTQKTGERRRRGAREDAASSEASGAHEDLFSAPRQGSASEARTAADGFDARSLDARGRKARSADAAQPAGRDSDAALKTAMTRSRRRGFSAASSAARGSVRLAASRRGITEARLLTHWAEIAGPRLAEICRPAKIRQRGGHALAGVLTLAVDGPRSAEISTEIPQIIERVNAYYGYSAVAEIQLLRAPGPLPPLRQPAPRARGASLDELPKATRQRVEDSTLPIQDDALRSALARLGANVIGRRKAAAKPSAAGNAV